MSDIIEICLGISEEVRTTRAKAHVELSTLEQSMRQSLAAAGAVETMGLTAS